MYNPFASIIFYCSKYDQDQPATVTFITAGYPRKEDTVPILLAMENGGADIIELGVPFSDPIADGPVIQETNTVCFYNALFNNIVLSISADCLEERYRLCYCPWAAQRGQN
jgi:tryptophan synthase alpha subunit